MTQDIRLETQSSIESEGLGLVHRSNIRIAWEKFLRHKLAVAAAILLTVLMIICYLAPLIAPFEFDAIDLSNIRKPPNSIHLLGTDALGRDLLTRLLYGGRISISIGLTAALLGTTLGTLVGSVCGYYGGRIDNLLMRLTDLAYSIPTLPLIIVIGAYSNTQAVGIVLIIGGFSWMQTARVVRGAILSVKENEYVTAAMALGAREVIDEIRRGALVHLGGAMSPFNAWLINRGLATLSLRMQRHQESALAVARFLEQHPRVGRVIYPGLESHPQRDLAERQMSGSGGMVVAQLDLQTATALVERVRVFTYATSLGDYQSLLFYYPSNLYVDEASYLDADQKRAIREWTGDGIMRLSIGLEDAADLVADLDRALGA